MGDEDFESIPQSTDYFDTVSTTFTEVITWGRTSVADGDTIAHGLGVVPKHIFVNGTVYRRLYVTVQAVTTTTFAVGLSRRKWGGATVSNGGTVNHGCGEVPDAVLLTARATDVQIYVSATNATNFTVAIQDLTVTPPIAYVGSINIYWTALVNCTSSYNVDWMAISYT